MSVYWTIQARRHLRQALAEALSREVEADRESKASDTAIEPDSCPGVLEGTMRHLDAMLADAFAGAPVVVKDQVIGYRRKKDQFTLMVEAFGPEGSGAHGSYVVKIGPEDAIRKEIHGWECCRPPGLKHDLVFLSLDKREPRRFDGQSWMCLVYGDAQQFLGVTLTLTFEAAALECVRSGFPKLPSIAFVVNELFERIGHLLYNQAFVDDPAASGPEYVLNVRHLDDGLNRWERDPSCKAARKDVNSLTVSGGERFLDPVDYLRYVQRHVAHHFEVDGQVEIRRHSSEGGPPGGLKRPSVREVVPRMLRGCGHGDLHGRNILVGIVRDQAMWPTVFDYEDMGASNLIGWDFVKLESELKARAYLDIFGGNEPGRFVKQVQEFEIALAKATEHCHLNRCWPDAGPHAADSDRLASILMTIRRMAAQHLGINHGRPNDWLEEYYFLLACYGATTSRFENLQPRERIGALISAGVAASRLSWPRANWQ